jgi:hypothetical protein
MISKRQYAAVMIIRVKSGQFGYGGNFYYPPLISIFLGCTNIACTNGLDAGTKHVNVKIFV